MGHAVAPEPARGCEVDAGQFVALPCAGLGNPSAAGDSLCGATGRRTGELMETRNPATFHLSSEMAVTTMVVP